MPDPRTREAELRKALLVPECNWSFVPDHYKCDVSFVSDFIRQARVLPAKAALERVLPQHVRLSREVTLAFLSRPDFPDLYATRQLFIPPNCASDVTVVKTYCTLIPRALQQADSALADNPTVVLAAIQRDGLELQYASPRLQCDTKMIRAACMQNAKAYVCWYPQASAWEAVFNEDREFLLHVLEHGGGDVMRKITNPERLRDPELWLAAVSNGLLVRFVPSWVGVDFWVEAVARNAKIYWELAPELQNREDMAISVCAATNVTEELLATLRERQGCKNIFNRTRDRTVALAVAAKAHFVQEYIQRHSSWIAQDEEIMVLAIRQRPSLYNSIHPFLQENLAIVHAALAPTSAHVVLGKLPNPWLQAHPEICVEAVRVADRMVATANAIPELVWQESRDLAMAWLQRNGGVLGIFAPRLSTDRELALAVVKHCINDWRMIGDTFKNDRRFLLEAARLNGRLLERLPEHVYKNDLELQIHAVASGLFRTPPPQKLHTHVTEQLATFDIFSDVVLPGIRCRDSTLNALHIDRETSVALQLRLAKLLGTPLGAELQLYRRCALQLQQPPKSQPPVPAPPSDFSQLHTRLRLGVDQNGNVPQDEMQREQHLLQFQQLFAGLDDVIPRRLPRLGNNEAIPRRLPRLGNNEDIPRPLAIDEYIPRLLRGHHDGLRDMMGLHRDMLHGVNDDEMEVDEMMADAWDL